MKAKHIDRFTRGGDPYAKLGVGGHRPLKVGDRFVIVRDVMWSASTHKWGPVRFRNDENDLVLKGGTKVRLAEMIPAIAENRDGDPIRGPQWLFNRMPDNITIWVYADTDHWENFMERI